MPKHRPDPTDFEMMTLSFRTLGKWHKVVHAAAQKAGLSADQYMRRIVIDWACSDMGLPAPDHEALTAGPNQISKAAALRGMSIKDFTAQAIREATARAIEAASPPRASPKSDFREITPRASSQSGTRKRVS